jgi:thymidine phosphorylase
MVELAGLASGADAEARVRAALASGAGLEVFRKCVAQQGGDPKVIDDYKRLPTVPALACVRAERAGYVAAIDAEKVGVAVRDLGGGRSRAADSIDPAVGVLILAKPGEPVGPGEAIFAVHYRDRARAEAVTALLASAVTLSDAPPAEGPLILEEIA